MKIITIVNSEFSVMLKRICFIYDTHLYENVLKYPDHVH